MFFNQNYTDGCYRSKILIPCQEEKTIRFSPCRGYYFDNPCCPEVYIGNNTTTTSILFLFVELIAKVEYPFLKAIFVSDKNSLYFF